MGVVQAVQPQEKVPQQQSVTVISDTRPLKMQEGERLPAFGRGIPTAGCNPVLNGTDWLADVGVGRPPENKIQLASHKPDHKKKTNPFKRAPRKFAKNNSSLDAVRSVLQAMKLAWD